jgi:recombination protein RecT
MSAPTAKVETFNPNKPAASVGEIRRFLTANANAIKRVAPQAMNPLRMVAILGAAMSRNPLLVKCTPMSLLRCLTQGAELGLEVAGGLQEFHPVPYWNSDLGAYEAQGLPGYPGLIKLVLQTGSVARIYAQAVYEGDTFDFALGDKPFLIHKPALENLGMVMEDEKIRAFYAVAFFKDGGAQFEVMGKPAVDALKKRALEKKKNTEHSPWNTDYVEMGRKTLIRRISKVLPKTPALARALDLQAQAESGEFVTEDILAQMPETSDIEGQKLPTEGEAGATVQGGEAKPVPLAMGPPLSEKQINAARTAAARVKLDQAGAERVIARVSNAPKAETKAFMDVIFSRDDAKLTALFQNHPDYPAPIQAPQAQEPAAQAEGEPPPPPPGDPAPPPPAG